MLRFVAALLVGEVLLLGGITFTPAGWPVACIVAGLQLVPAVLLSEHEKPKRGVR